MTKRQLMKHLLALLIAFYLGFATGVWFIEYLMELEGA